MKTARIILLCLCLVFLASTALAYTVPNYVSVTQQTEKWYQSAGIGKYVTLKMHTLVEGSFNGATILNREIWLNSDIIESERLLFSKDPEGNISFFGDLNEDVFEDPILWVKAPLTVGQTWTDSRPEIPCCTDPDNMVHYIFAVLDTKEITCPAGTFECARVFLSVLYPDGHTENESYWYSPSCGMVMCLLDNQRVFELHKAIIPGIGDFPDVRYDDPTDGANLSGLKAYPNPLNPKADISFELKTRSRVQLRVYDVAGKLVRTLVAGDVMNPGTCTVSWNGKDDRGSPVASGTYIYRLQAGDSEGSNRMTLIR